MLDMGTPRFQQASDGRVVLIMPGHLQTLWRPAVAYISTMDVYNLVSSCRLFADDQTALWRAHKRSVGVAGKVIEQWQAHNNKICDVAWIPFTYDNDGQGESANRSERGYLATCAVDHTVKLWRVGSCCHPMLSPFDEGCSATASDAVMESQRASELPPPTLAPKFTLVGHAEEVRGITPLYPAHMVCSPGGGLPSAPKFLMASCGNDKSLRVWDPWVGGRALRKIGGEIDGLTKTQSKIGHTDKVLCITHLPVHGYIATGGADKVIKLWRLPSGYSENTSDDECIHHREWGYNATASDTTSSISVYDNVWSQLNMSSLTGLQLAPSSQKRPKTDVEQKHEFERACFVEMLEGHRDCVRCIVAVPNHGCSDQSPHNREYMASGADDKSIFLWDFSSSPPTRVRKLRQHTGEISCLAMLPPPLDRIPVPSSGQLTGESVRLSGEHLLGVGSQLLLASGSYDGSVRVWDLHTGESVRDFRVGVGGVSRAWVTSLAVYPKRIHGETLIISGYQRAIRIWSLENVDATTSRCTAPGLVRTLTEPQCSIEVEALAMLPGGLIAIGGADGKLRVIA